MFASIIAKVIAALGNDVLQWIGGMIATEQAKRQNIATGKLEQHAADSDASIKDAQDAAKVTETVRAESPDDLDRDLERVRHGQPPAAPAGQ